MGNGRWMAEDNGNRIEAHLFPLDPGSRYITAGCPCDVLLLFEIDGPFGSAEVRRRTRLYFHEYDQVAAARDDIDF